MDRLYTLSIHNLMTNTRTWQTWDGNWTADIVSYPTHGPNGFKSARYFDRDEVDAAARAINPGGECFVDVIEIV